MFGIDKSFTIGISGQSTAGLIARSTALLPQSGFLFLGEFASHSASGKQ